MSQTRGGTGSEHSTGNQFWRQRLRLEPLWERRLNSRRKQLDHLYELMSKHGIVHQDKNKDIFAPIQIDSSSSEVGDYLTFSSALTPAEKFAVDGTGDVTTFPSTDSIDDSVSANPGLFSVGLLLADAHPHTTQTHLQEDHELIRKDEKGKQRNTEVADWDDASTRKNVDSDTGKDLTTNDPAEENSISAKYACPHPGCEKVFVRQFHVRRHVLTHENKKPFKCPHKGCQARFTRRDNCTQHQRTKHGFSM